MPVDSPIKRRVSTIAIAVCLLAAIDLAFGYLHPLKNVKTVGIDRGEPYNATAAVRKSFAVDGKDIKQGKAISEVVLLGSSLVVAPSLQSEAAFQAHPLERFKERRLTYFEDCLKKALNTKADLRSYLLATGGEMASDAYFLEKNVLLNAPDNGQHMAVIYGIAPRDFQDNLFPRVDSSGIFQVLGGLDDLPVVYQSQPGMTFDEGGSVFLGRLSSLMRYRLDLLRVLTVRGKRTIEKLVPGVMFEKYNDSLALKRQKDGLFPEEAQGTPLVYPAVAIDHNDWKKTNYEYIRRYNPIDKSKSEIQFAYFERFLQLAAAKHLNVLVVNMPISIANKDLIPPGFYDGYVSRTKALCTQYGADYANMNGESWSDNKNYVDSVHLKPEVSQAFLQDLAKAVARSSIAVAAVHRGASL